MESRYIVWTWIIASMLMLSACRGDDVPGAEAPVAVNFSATVPTFSTRSVPACFTRAIVNSTSDLQTPGFGVFAYHTGTYTWAQCDGSGEEGHTAAQAPNFMYNQQVSGSTWTYLPVKYWPNDNQPADDQTPAAQGSVAHSYVSFFAYAPYGGTGLTLSENTATGAPTVGYTWVNSVDPDSQADLLYAAPVLDCYKTMAEGYGTVSGRVPFTFRHALAAVEFKVRRKDATGSPIILSSLTMNSSADASAATTDQAKLNTSGTFNLGTSAWSSFDTTSPEISYDAVAINSDLKGAHSDNATLTGVTAYTDATAHALTTYTPTLLLMPHETAVTIPFTLSYTLGGTAKSPSSSITFSQPEGGWALAMGKKYTVIFIIDGGEVESYLLRAQEAEQW